MTTLLDDLIPTQLEEPTPCTEHNDPEIWFPATPEAVTFAKSLCRTCPIAASCLDGAVRRDEGWGVWGGELFEHGRIVRTKRGRGRPRKNPDAVRLA